MLENLSAGAEPLWGKMTPQHMVEHLILTMKCSNGKLEINCQTEEEKLLVLKRFLMSGRPLPKNFVNPVIGPDLQPLEFGNIEDAVKKLRNEISDYFLFFEKYPLAAPVNPTFGKLNRDEWDVFHKKHFSHHLEQFGLISEIPNKN